METSGKEKIIKRTRFKKDILGKKKIAFYID